MRTGARLLLLLVACKSPTNAKEVELEIVDVAEPRADAGTAAPCGTDMKVTFVDVRREPKDLARHGAYLYWIDEGKFVGEGDDTRYVEDGAIWRLADGAPEQVATGLGVPRGIVVDDEGIVVADRRGEPSEGGPSGLWLYPHDGGASRQIWSGGWVKLVRDDLIAIDDTPDQVWRGVRQPVVLLRDAGYVEAVAVSADGSAAVAGLVDGNTLSGIVTVLRGGEVVRRLSLGRRWVRGVVFDGEELLVAAGPQLLRIGSQGAAATVEHTTGDEFYDLRVHEGIVFWIDAMHGPRFSIRAARPGQRAIELAAGEGAAWRLAIDDDAVYFVVSSPVADPYTKEPTPYRIGRVAWRECVPK